MSTSSAPERSISRRTTASTFLSTRRPSGKKSYRPEPTRRTNPARVSKTWLTPVASAGASLTVGMSARENRMVVRRVYHGREQRANRPLPGTSSTSFAQVDTEFEGPLELDDHLDDRSVPR